MKIESKFHILTQVLLYIGSSLQLYNLWIMNDDTKLQWAKGEGVYIRFPSYASKLSNLLNQIYLLSLNRLKCLLHSTYESNAHLFTISKEQK